MITATLKHFERVRDQWRITILYTDTEVAANSFEKSYRRNSITKTKLKALARAEAAAIDVNDETDITSNMVGATIDVTPDPVVEPDPPTAEEVARSEWFADYRKLQSMLQVVADVPALDSTQSQTAITNLRTSLTNDWLNSYLGDI